MKLNEELLVVSIVGIIARLSVLICFSCKRSIWERVSLIINQSLNLPGLNSRRILQKYHRFEEVDGEFKENEKTK